MKNSSCERDGEEKILERESESIKRKTIINTRESKKEYNRGGAPMCENNCTNPRGVLKWGEGGCCTKYKFHRCINLLRQQVTR